MNHRIILGAMSPLLMLTSFAFASRPALADVPFCYMQMSSGSIVNLTGMCGNPANNAVQPPDSLESQEISSEARGEALRSSAILYADSYCESRAQGLTHRQSSDQATSTSAGYMVSNGLSADDISTEWYEQARSDSEALCPELQPTTRYN